MYYIPIIKLKSREMVKAHFIKSALNHENVIPFLELRFNPNDSRKNHSLNEFLHSTNVNKFFLGIPHKPSVIKVKDTRETDNYLANANITRKRYLDEVQELFDFKNCTPVFYVYSKDDLTYAYEFIEYGHYLERQIGIITTPSLSRIFNKKLLDMRDYLFIDLEDKTIASQKPSLEMITSSTTCNLIIVRENRKSNTYNTQIVTDKPAPLLNDLSTEFDNIKRLNIRVCLFGFADYCGFKNDISIDGQGMDASEFYPAVALYMKEDDSSYFLGIRSDSMKKEGGFQRLLELVKERIEILDPCRKTPIEEMLKEINIGDFAIWNVITQWFYISKMVDKDDWKNVVIKNY